MLITINIVYCIYYNIIHLSTQYIIIYIANVIAIILI